MPLKVIDTVKKGFGFLAEDPGLIALFALPLIGVVPLAAIGAAGIGKITPTVFFPILLFVAGFTIISFLLRILAQAAAILKVNQLNKGRKLSFVDSLRKGLGKFPRLLAASILMYIIMVAIFSPILGTFVFFYAFIIKSKLMATKMGALAPAVLGFPYWIFFLIPISIIIGIYVGIRLALFSPACVLEDKLGLTSSWNLVKGSWWSIFGILLVFIIISLLIGLIPFIGSILVTLFIDPAIIASITLAYFDLKGP